MNFLMRSTQSVAAEPTPVHESHMVAHHVPKPTASLEVLIAEDQYPRYSPVEDHDGETDDFIGENASTAVPDSKEDSTNVAKHFDVSEEEGWIMIPYGTLFSRGAIVHLYSVDIAYSIEYHFWAM